jgi:oxygen-independent coproporphyrinogen-3 oxidase
MIEDLCAFAPSASEYTVETVYFGGGTPTLLQVSDFTAILSTIAAQYTLSEHAEITAECNPGTVDFAYLSALRQSGVNRLSIGLQSANANELRLLGRIHTAEDFLRTVEDARRADFTNLSADLMFGIPDQTVESFRETLSFLLRAAPEHVSVYGLKIEEGTAFYARRDALTFPDEDAEEEMYLDAVSILKDNGLFRYEISNFARPGYLSRHNYAYWTLQDYIGFGPAAHSYFAGERFSNSRDFAAYLRGASIEDSRETVTADEALREHVMLHMRLEAGVSASAYDRLAGRNGAFLAQYGAAMRQYVQYGFIRETDDGFAFTTKGFRVSNYILSEIL